MKRAERNGKKKSERDRVTARCLFVLDDILFSAIDLLPCLWYTEKETPHWFARLVDAFQKKFFSVFSQKQPYRARSPLVGPLALSADVFTTCSRAVRTSSTRGGYKKESDENFFPSALPHVGPFIPFTSLTINSPSIDQQWLKKNTLSKPPMPVPP